MGDSWPTESRAHPSSCWWTGHPCCPQASLLIDTVNTQTIHPTKTQVMGDSWPQPEAVSWAWRARPEGSNSEGIAGSRGKGGGLESEIRDKEWSGESWSDQTVLLLGPSASLISGVTCTSRHRGGQVSELRHSHALDAHRTQAGGQESRDNADQNFDA